MNEQKKIGAIADFSSTVAGATVKLLDVIRDIEPNAEDKELQIFLLEVSKETTALQNTVHEALMKYARVNMRLYWVKVFKLSKNKSLEFQIEGTEGPVDWFVFSIETQTRCDHGGLYFRFSLLRLFYIGITFYDHRHWDYAEGRYVDYSELE